MPVIKRKRRQTTSPVLKNHQHRKTSKSPNWARFKILAMERLLQKLTAKNKAWVRQPLKLVQMKKMTSFQLKLRNSKDWPISKALQSLSWLIKWRKRLNFSRLDRLASKWSVRSACVIFSKTSITRILKVCWKLRVSKKMERFALIMSFWWTAVPIISSTWNAWSNNWTRRSIYSVRLVWSLMESNLEINHQVLWDGPKSNSLVMVFPKAPKLGRSPMISHPGFTPRPRRISMGTVVEAIYLTLKKVDKF